MEVESLCAALALDLGCGFEVRRRRTPLAGLSAGDVCASPSEADSSA